jgi:hypothetical protein
MLIRKWAVASAAAAALSVAVPAQAFQVGSYHIFPTRQYEQQTGRVPQLGAGEMLYYGGTVFSNVKVVSVIWGSNVDSQTVATMPGYLNALPNSTFMDLMKEYKTKHVHAVNGHRGSRQTISRGTFVSQVQITPQNQSLSLSDNDIHKELRYQISIGALPPNDLNTLYMIYFPNNITITLDGLVSCQSFGAYHFAINDTKESKNNVFYGVMPGCSYSLQSHEIISAHEFAEATTDNIPTPGSNPDYPQAWNNSTGYEIGDLCEGTQGTLTAGKTTYYVQQIYINSLSGCSTGNYTSP